MKLTANFRLNSTTKYILSSITDKESRDIFRQNMVQAQLQSEVKPVREEKKKK